MQPVLDALNYLASTPFIINGPVLDFMLRREEPRIQKLAADVAELERELIVVSTGVPRNEDSIVPAKPRAPLLAHDELLRLSNPTPEDDSENA
jgi:hypothetical protein